MTRKGMTLVEVMVSITLFSIVLLVCVRAFIQMNNLRAIGLNARESQQKLRLGIEMMSRYARQADKVVISGTSCGNNCSEIAMYFNINQAANRYGVKFQVNPSNNGGLVYFECPMTSAQTECTSWGTGQNLLGSYLKLMPPSGFVKNEVVDLSTGSDPQIAMPPSLSIYLKGVMSQGNLFYQRTFNVDTRVILENIK